jgi:hypothetical protein
MSGWLPPVLHEAAYAAPAGKIRYPRPRGPARTPRPGDSTYRRSYGLSPLLAALGIDYTLEDVVELATTDPDRAERKLASYRKALVPITRQLREAEADTDAVLRLAQRAKAEGKPAIELVPEVAAAEGWKVRGNPRRKLTITTANGRTMTLAPRVKPAPQPRNRGPRARSPRRRKIRSTAAASRDGPESDSDPLSPRPARAGLEAVLFPAASPLAEGCEFVGCDVDVEAIETTRRRLEA